MKTAASFALVLALAATALAAGQTRAGYEWRKLCTAFPPFQGDIKTESPAPDSAVAALKEFAGKYPKAAETAKALYLLGQCHYSRGKASLAVKAYWRCVEDFPKSKAAEDAAFGIVRVYGSAKLWDAGRKQIDKLAGKLGDPKYAADLMRRFNALQHLQVGSQPPAFAVKDIDGRPLSLDMFKGKVVVLIFWATWCPNCTREAPLLVNALKQVDRKQVEVVSISLDRDVATLRAYCRKVGATGWRHDCDGMRYNGEVAKLYDITQIPQLFLLDRKGVIRYMNTRGPLIAPRLKELVKGRD